MQHFCFDTGLGCFKYAILVAGRNPSRDIASKTFLDNLAVSGGGRGGVS